MSIIVPNVEPTIAILLFPISVRSAMILTLFPVAVVTVCICHNQGTLGKLQRI